MRNKVLVIFTFCFLLVISGCATTSVAGKDGQEVDSIVTVDGGHYRCDKIRTLSDEDIVSNISCVTENKTGLKVAVVNGLDVYEEMVIKDTPLSKVKERMGENKFSAYWAFSVKAFQIREHKTEDDRMVKWIFENGDYMVYDLAGSLKDMNMSITHTDPAEMILFQILVPVTFKMKK